jgi:hypothetical protein
MKLVLPSRWLAMAPWSMPKYGDPGLHQTPNRESKSTSCSSGRS